MNFLTNTSSTWDPFIFSNFCALIILDHTSLWKFHRKAKVVLLYSHSNRKDRVPGECKLNYNAWWLKQLFTRVPFKKQWTHPAEINSCALDGLFSSAHHFWKCPKGLVVPGTKRSFLWGARAHLDCVFGMLLGNLVVFSKWSPWFWKDAVNQGARPLLMKVDILRLKYRGLTFKKKNTLSSFVRWSCAICMAGSP